MRVFIVFCVILVLAVCLPATTSAEPAKIVKVEITNDTDYESFIVLDPHEYWIELLEGKNRVVMPDLKFIYNGFNSTQYSYSDSDKNVNITTYGINDSEDYEFDYPPDNQEFSLPFYYGNENVTATLHGEMPSQEDAYVYLLRIPFEDFKKSFDSAVEGDTDPIRDLINDTVVGNETANSTQQVDFGKLSPGDYVVAATLNKSSSDNITLLSATPFEVLEHTSEIDVPQEVERMSDSTSDTIEGTFNIIGGSDSANYTYLAVLIREDAYSLDVRLESNGTKDLTNLSINGAQIIKSWKIGGVGWENITGITVRDWVTEAFEPNSASIDLGKGTKGNSFGFSLLIDEDYDDGNYYLNVGAWNLSDPSQDLVAFKQDVIKVTTVPPADNDNNVNRRGGGGGGGGGGGISIPPLLAGSAALYTSFHTFYDDTESTIDIPSNYASETGVVRLRGKTAAVTTVSFAVSRVNNLPSNIPQPDSEVYRTFEVVFTEFGTTNLVEPSGSIEFKVNKDWINEKKFDPEDIVLQKYKEGWQELETELMDEDGDYYYYEADMDSFSIFAVTAPIGTSISPPPIQPTTPSPAPAEPNMTVTEKPSSTPEATPSDKTPSFFDNPAILLIIVNAVVIGIIALIVYLKRI